MPDAGEEVAYPASSFQHLASGVRQLMWLDVLNASPSRVNWGERGAIEVLHWAYAPHLLDNAPHRHTFVEACLVGRYGEGRFTHDGQEHAIRAGDLFLARPGVTHQIQNLAVPGMELFWASFVLPDVLAAATLRPVVPDDGSLFATWNALRAVGEARDTRTLEPLKTALLQTLLRLAMPDEADSSDARDSRTRDASLMRVAARYIADNLDRRLPVSEVAAHIGLSTRHLSRLMTSHLEAAPADYIEGARLERARTLLRSCDLPLKAVAAQVGYQDARHFSRAFAKRFGTPPGAFRRGEE